MPPPGIRQILNATVVVSALGYFVDIFDLILFSVVRVPSLRALGLEGDALLDTGVLLLNMQMAGMLVGGIVWGILGDRRGRVSVLFGSILLYSAATLANAFVASVPQYAALRFVAGLGLAGELGAAVTLVSEVMPKATRGYGTAIVAAVGILGAVAAAIVADAFSWKAAYIVGGVLGLVLLVARFTLRDSPMFHALRGRSVGRGDLRLLFGRRESGLKYLWCILIGAPLWFVIGILVTFSPEISRDVAVTGPVVGGTAILWCYAGLSVGDLASGFLSQRIRSRRTVLIVFIALTSALIYVYVFSRGLSPTAFYVLCSLLGFAAGYWAVFVTNAAEQFGTNLRATVATTVPNLVRGSIVPITIAFTLLKGPLGLARSAMVIGQALVLLALWGVRSLPETYNKDLDYVESSRLPTPTGLASPAPAGGP